MSKTIKHTTLTLKTLKIKNMNYIIKTTSNDKFLITEKEYEAILNQKGLVALPRLGAVININCIVCIYKEDDKEIYDQKLQETRQLNSGVVAKKINGIWYDANNFFEGKNVKLDLDYFPELKEKKQKENNELKKINILEK